MPRRNVSERDLLGPRHSYNRGRAGRAIFRDDADRDFFFDLIAARLGRDGYIHDVELCALCLMTTHFHLVLWQHTPGAITRLMKSLMVAYVMYYNRKYGTHGPSSPALFRSRHLNGRKDLRWTIAYVHANHPTGPGYRYSTHSAYLDDHQRPGWLALDKPLAAFGDKHDYADFMQAHATRAKLNARFF